MSKRAARPIDMDNERSRAMNTAVLAASEALDGQVVAFILTDDEDAVFIVAEPGREIDLFRGLRSADWDAMVRQAEEWT